MPRNVSGTYSLPLPPVVPNTVIQAAWANTTTDDIAQGITDSLDRNGRGGMIAPFRLVDGTVLQPAFAFASETGTGIYKASAGIMGVAVMGVQVAQWSSSAYTLATDLNVTGDLGVTGNIAFNGSLSITGDVIFTGNLAVDGDLGLTGTISVSGGIASLDDISVDENFDGSAGFFATNISTGTHSYAVFRANNNTGHAVGLAAIGSANTDWPGNSDTGVLFSDHGQGISLIATAGSSMIRFYDGGFTEHMRLSGGSLGIGGGAPYDKLSVLNGSFQVVSGYGGVGSTPTQRYMIFGAVNSFGGSAVAPAGLSVQYTRVSGDTDYGSDLLFLTSADNSGVEQMRIDRLGNVGIGVSTILAALHLKRTSGSATLFIEATAGSAGIALKGNTTGGGTDQISFQNAAGGTMYALGASNIGSIGATDFSLYSYITSQNVLTVLAAGGVIVGNPVITVQPTPKFMVNGGSTISSLANFVTNANTTFVLANPAVRLGIGYTAADLPEIQAFDSNPAPRNLVLQRYGGAVGIGGTPSIGVHLMAAGSAARFRVSSTDPGGVICDYLADGSTSAQIGTSTSHPLTFYTAFAVRLSLGAGTLAPVHHVYNNVFYTAANDPGPTPADIPIGGIIMGRGVGAFTGCTFGSVVTFSGSQFVSVPGLGGGAAQNITTGQWRFCGHDTNASNLDVSLWMKIAY